MEEEVGAQAHRQVYLVTLPHPKQAVSSTGVPLVAPETLTKNQVLERVLDSLRNPMRMDARHGAGGSPGIAVQQVGVWRPYSGKGLARIYATSLYELPSPAPGWTG